MAEKERFQRAFAPLHASPDTMTEVMKMIEQKKSRNVFRKTVAMGLAAVLILALGGIAYAADLGGIQRTVQLWIHGDQTEAVMTVEAGQYTLDYIDENGEKQQRGGGGVAIAEDGTERPLTEEELMEMLYSPEIEYKDDGTVVVYYYGQTLDITDRFGDDDVCYVQLQNGGKTIYMTIKYQNGYAMSTEKYVPAREFN